MLNNWFVLISLCLCCSWLGQLRSYSCLLHWTVTLTVVRMSKWLVTWSEWGSRPNLWLIIMWIASSTCALLFPVWELCTFKFKMNVVNCSLTELTTKIASVALRPVVLISVPLPGFYVLSKSTAFHGVDSICDV